jgi:hypothetical protein
MDLATKGLFNLEWTFTAARVDGARGGQLLEISVGAEPWLSAVLGNPCFSFGIFVLCELSMASRIGLLPDGAVLVNQPFCNP